MPSRVLEILNPHSDNRRVRLIECKLEESIPYAALSYCWGDKGNITTTTNNIHDHLAGFDVQDLPPTLQDALLVTEKLGFNMCGLTLRVSSKMTITIKDPKSH